MIDELPQGWATATLGEICSKPQYGWTSPAAKIGKTKYLRTTDISGGTIDWQTVPFCAEAPDDLDKYRVRENDILVSRAGSVGVSYRVAEAPDNSVFASYLIRFKPLAPVEPKYVELFLKSDAYWRSISEFSAGIAVPNVNASKLASLELPLAPANEQQRIVTKLAKLLGKVEACQQRLEKIPILLKRFRQSVLAAACSGRLTADWRDENPDIQTVQMALSKADKLRATNLSKANAQAGFKKFRFKQAALIDLGNKTKGIDDLFDLPDTWAWASLGQLTWFVADGPHFSPKYVDQADGVPFISGRNVSYHGIDFADAKYVSKADHQEFSKRARPVVGDVLLTKGGTTGIATVVETEEQFSIWVHVALLKIVPELVTPYYLRDVLTAPFAYTQSQAQTHGVGNQDLGLTRMVHIALPLPPVAEQQEIVRRVKAFFALADQIEARSTQARVQVDKLTPSLLARAFRGELVPQDPNDEPASVLLERISNGVTTPKARRSHRARFSR